MQEGVADPDSPYWCSVKDKIRGNPVKATFLQFEKTKPYICPKSL